MISQNDGASILVDVIFSLGTLNIISKPIEEFFDDLFADNVKVHLQKFCKIQNVLIIGTNPSNKSPDNSAFHPSTKSRKTIDSWFTQDSDTYKVSFLNLIDEKTSSTEELRRLIKHNSQYIDFRLNYFIKHEERGLLNARIVAVGTIASETLKKYNIKHFAMPHPSGLNRFWNDKEAGAAKIKEMLDWIKS